jgi:hypothetical protein
MIVILSRKGQVEKIVTPGAVHAWVSQKLLKSNFYNFYLLSQSCDWKPILPKVILNVNQSLK